MRDTKKVQIESVDIKETQKEKLKQLFPEVFNEEKVDFEKLKLSLGEDVDTGRERYGMNWPGKTQAIKVAQLPSEATLKPDEKASVDFDKTQNLFIEGDNLEVLKLLQKSYFGKIKMCYIDPPYNTGNEFIYPDKYEEGLQTYLQYTGQIDAEGKKFSTNVETDGRFHSKWMNMMWPRLFLTRNLLTEDGVIFISIDDHEVDNLKKICCEVFGEENFIAQIIWERAYSPVNLKKYFSESHDYILCFAKNLSKIESLTLSRTDAANDRYQNLDNDPRGVWKSSDFSVGPAVQENVYEIITPSGRKVLPPNGRSWRVSKEKFEQLYKDNKVWFGDNGSNVPSQKRFLSDVKEGITPMTLWKYTEVGHSQEATKKLKELFDDKQFFEYPKPVGLIKRCIELSTSDNDIILDFFAGSGTTAHSVLLLNAEDSGNRKFIVTQLPEKTPENSEAYKAGYSDITAIAEERIRRAGKKILEENRDKEGFDAKTFDKGFKVFKLDKSNFSVWDETTDGNLQKKLELHVNNTDPKSKEADILYEILVKAGFELSEKIEEITMYNKKVYSISEGKLLICLDKMIDKDFVRSLAVKKPKQFICLNSSFKEDADLTNTAKILENNQIEFRTI